VVAGDTFCPSVIPPWRSRCSDAELSSCLQRRAADREEAFRACLSAAAAQPHPIRYYQVGSCFAQRALRREWDITTCRRWHGCEGRFPCSNGVCCFSGTVGCISPLSRCGVCCFPDQVCCNGSCCPRGAVCCSGRCCSQGEVCCNGRCVTPQCPPPLIFDQCKCECPLSCPGCMTCVVVAGQPECVTCATQGQCCDAATGGCVSLGAGCTPVGNVRRCCGGNPSNPICDPAFC
jgi:hypothetical protein